LPEENRIITYKRSYLILAVAALLFIAVLFFVMPFSTSIRKSSLKWRYKTSGPVISSPIIENGVVYVGSSDGYIYAIKSSSS